MRDSYDYSPQARAAGLRRLRTLTWRTTQLGALTTVGFAVVFARTAPAHTASQPVSPATPAAATGKAAAVTPATKHQAKPDQGATSAAVPSLSAASQPASPASPTLSPPTAGPSAARSSAPATAAPSPTLSPPATAPSAAPTTAAPVPTVTSTSHGGG
jgi:hypothetical protein